MEIASAGVVGITTTADIDSAGTTVRSRPAAY
jgi:hypothetical protein